MKRLPRALFMAVVLLTAPALCPADAQSGYFLRGYYLPASGRVSQPFRADVTFEANDMPANCVAEWKDLGVSGDLPPGLAFADSTSTVIAGTPTLAGDWPVTITFHDLGCTYDAKDGVDRAINVRFHIAP